MAPPPGELIGGTIAVMASVFCDSFETTTDFLEKWSSGEPSYNGNPSFVRTGIQSLTYDGAGGFAGLPRINFSLRTTMIAGVAFYQSSGIGSYVFFFQNAAAGAQYCTVGVNEAGAIGVLAVGSMGPLTYSAPGVVPAGVYCYIEVKCTFTQTGRVEVRVNGQTVLTVSEAFSVSGFDGVDSFLLTGNDIQSVYYDDFYLLDGTGSVNNDFLGAVRIYAIYPDGNETPLNFTPLSGTNFSEVNQAPPPGDSAYVSDNTNGAIDQYHYTITGPVGAFGIKFIQHSLCCRLDSAGSHTVGSQINSTTLNTVQIGSNAVGPDYEYALFPWDLNPNTGLPFQAADFATTFVGPVITS